MQGRIADGPLTLDSGVPESPHMMPQCIYIVTNTRRLHPAQYQKLKEHYKECTYCQVRVVDFLRVRQREKQAVIDSITPERVHLQRFVAILHSIVREDIAAYIDALEEHGVSRANKRFLSFAEHLDYCGKCRNSIEEYRKWLKAD